MKAKKDLKRKMPKRSPNEQYWTEGQFQKLTQSPPSRLRSRGPLPWRLLAYMLQASPEVDRLRTLVAKRLSDPRHLESGQKQLERMLEVLWKSGYVELEPPPPKPSESSESQPDASVRDAASGHRVIDLRPPGSTATGPAQVSQAADKPAYKPVYARPTRTLEKLLLLRGINPLYGVFLVNQLGIADRCERVQAMESVLEIPRSMLFQLRVPLPDQMPPGPLATTRLDVQLLQLGLASAEELGAAAEEEEADRDRRVMFPEERVRVLTLADKLRRLFDYDFPGVSDVITTPVWAAGELLEFGGDFNKYITSKALQKQEGIVFRHCLRLILLCYEFTQFCPPDADPSEWRDDLEDIAKRLTEACRKVDPDSTDKTLEEAAGATKLP